MTDIKQLVCAEKKDAAFELRRRGYSIGYFLSQTVEQASLARTSQSSDSRMFPTMLKPHLGVYADDIERSAGYYQAVVTGSSMEPLLEKGGLLQKISTEFELLSVSFDESDRQQVELLDFDLIPAADDSGVWLKVSRLSFATNDQSLRFRFSFGMDGYEDVGADAFLASQAARLAELCFPECELVTSSTQLQKSIGDLVNDHDLSFVERIIYFNAPDGGAQFHQDVEPGHYGIVYAQLSGQTAWIALPKQTLVSYIQDFVLDSGSSRILENYFDAKDRSTLEKMCQSASVISACLDDRADLILDKLVNQVAEFSRLLVAEGYGYLVQPGDALWLPQQDMEDCVWHSVYCVGDTAGQALSFAVRHSDSPS